MDDKKSLVAILSILSLYAMPAHAQSPLVQLPLDGSVANSGNAGVAELLSPEGADPPQFVAGHDGQALSLGKGGGVAIPYEFNQEEHPQATVTMWIRIDQDSPYERELLSIGPGNGLLMTVSGQRKISVRSYRSAMHDTAFPLGEWVFVAGVVDNDAGAIRIQQNDGIFEATGLDIRKPSSLSVTAPGSDERKHYIFVGADDFNSAAKEMKHIALDDVRLYDYALSQSEVDVVRSGGPTAIADAPDTGSGDAPIVVAEIPKGTTRPLPDTTTVGGLGGEGESEAQRPNYPDIKPVPDSGPDITGALPDAEETSDAPSWEDIGTGGRDFSGMDTGKGPRPIDLPEEAQKEQAENMAGSGGDEAVIEQRQGLAASDTKKVYAIGEKSYSGISGIRGDEAVQLDLVSTFIRYLQTAEENNRPCNVEISGIQGDYFPGDPTEWKQWIGCKDKGKDGATGFGGVSVALGFDVAIGRLQVCRSNQAGSDRIKGLFVHGMTIAADGTTSYSPDNYAKNQNSNCGEWLQDVSCPASTLATGIVIHYREGSSLRRRIVGMQLICRDIGVR